MGLWAEATLTVPNPKHFNIKKFVLDVLGNRKDLIIVNTTYSKECGVSVEIRTDCYLGDSFNSILVEISKKLKQKSVGYFYIELKRNWYNL